jgi:sRNA-binding protein
MLCKSLMGAAAVSALMITSSAAFAQAECGGIWAARCNAKARAQPAKKKSNDAAREETPAASEGGANASATGTANADQNAIVMAGSLGATTLSGLSTGQTVKSSGGTALGKVSKIVKGSDGSVTQVIVTSPTGRSFPITANKLSVSGGVVVVTDSSEQ